MKQLAPYQKDIAGLSALDRPQMEGRYDFYSIMGLWSMRTMLLGAGGRYPRALCGLTVL
jgi:hypothetical protein